MPALIGDKPLTAAERSRRWREKNPEQRKYKRIMKKDILTPVKKSLRGSINAMPRARRSVLLLGEKRTG